MPKKNASSVTLPLALQRDVAREQSRASSSGKVDESFRLAHVYPSAARVSKTRRVLSVLHRGPSGGATGGYLWRCFEREFKEMTLDLDWTKTRSHPLPAAELASGRLDCLCGQVALVLPKELRDGYRKCSRCSKWFFARSQNSRHRFCSMTCRVAYQRHQTPYGRTRNKKYRREWRKCQVGRDGELEYA